jgi:hypothetical protein
MRAVIIRSAFVAAAAIFMVPQAVAAPATAASPLNGTWKLDPAASKFSGPAIRSETRTYEVTGDKVKMSSTGTDASGGSISYSYSAAYDGKFYPMIGNPMGDSVSLKRVDARTVDATVKKGGAVSAHAKLSVSANGERLTFTRKMLRGKEAPAVDTFIYAKQH